MDPRPTSVTAARWLLVAVAVSPLLSSVLGLVLLDDLTRAYLRAYGGMRGEDEAGGAAIVGLLFGVAFAVVYAVPALLLGRPRRWVRIVTWVLCVPGMICLSPGLLGGSSLTSPRNLSPGSSTKEINARIADELPVWYVPATIALAAVSVLGALLVVVLLAVPASNAYFRTRPAGPPPQAYLPSPS